VRADNERILKTQEELNAILLEKLCNQNTDKNKGKNSSNSKIAQPKKKERKLEYPESETESVYKDTKDTETSTESSSSPKQRTKKKPKQHDEVMGEFKKIKPPTFNGEVETGEEAEAWLSGMHKYFQIYNYSSELKAQMAIYNLTEKEDIWWQDIKRVKSIKERKITWKTFKRYFKKQYLSEQYYEGKAKEFYELKLGNLTMKYLCSKFLSLLHYVPYIVDEKPKIQ
jgi:hypothetical protein